MISEKMANVPFFLKLYDYLEEKTAAIGVTGDDEIGEELLKEIIIASIQQANNKIGRAILDIPEGVTEDRLSAIYQKEGRELFKYFQEQYDDPASTSYTCLGKHYSAIGKKIYKEKRSNKSY